MSKESDCKGTQLTCKKCKYSWCYKRDLWLASCPKCGNKVKVPRK